MRPLNMARSYELYSKVTSKRRMRCCASESKLEEKEARKEFKLADVIILFGSVEV